LPIGDTLRYSERTDGMVRIEGPQGSMEVRTEHDARLALARTSPTSANAWYESLHLRQDGPGPQQQTPDTDPLLQQPFTLTFPPDGRLALQTAPALPPEIAQMTDLRRQFDDFFITVPAKPLALGVEWADTASYSRTGRPSETFTAHLVRRYRAVRDTVALGSPAVIIEVTQDIRIEGTSPMEMGGQTLTAGTVLQGGETGFAVFSPSTGRLLVRSRRGVLDGHFTVTGGAQPLSLPQYYEYTSRLELAQ
jgi:hypothetical protein